VAELVYNHWVQMNPMFLAKSFIKSVLLLTFREIFTISNRDEPNIILI
jgi:hypothetical protein